MNKLEQLLEKKEHLYQGGGEKRIESQHKKGKLTARERLNILFDKDTFVEMDTFVKNRCPFYGMPEKDMPGDGVVTGYGQIDGRLVFAFAQDFTVGGGSLGEYHGEKIVKVQGMALKMGAPFVGLQDSGGARIEEGVAPLSTTTPFHQALFRRFLSSWDRAQAAQFTHRRLQTSSSW